MKRINNYIFKTLSSNKMLYISLFVSIITYSGWTFFPKGFFYKGNALFLMLFVSYIYGNDRKSFIKHLMFNLSLNYFIKEMFLNPRKLYFYEAIALVLIPMIWYIKHGKFT